MSAEAERALAASAAASGPRKTTLERAIGELERALRSALTASGIAEHRALVTGSPVDAKAYSASLKAVSEAYARLWAYEAHGSKARVHDVERDRASAQAEIASLGADVASQIASGKPAADLARTRASMLEAHRRLVAIMPLPEDAVRVPAPFSSTAVAPAPAPAVGKATSHARIRRKIRKSAA